MIKSKWLVWILQFGRSLLILLAFVLAGRLLSSAINGVLPASIIGMLLLTCSLAMGWIKLHWVELGANTLLRWLSLLFVPISVALVEQFDLLLEYGVSILFVLVFSTLTVIFFAGRLWQWLEKA